MDKKPNEFRNTSGSRIAVIILILFIPPFMLGYCMTEGYGLFG